MGKEDVLSITSTIETSDKRKVEKDFEVTDPIKDLNLGESAWRVEKLPMENTKKELKGLGLSYYVLRGGKVTSKELNEKEDAVIFNKGRSEEFEVALNGKKSLLRDRLDVWYANKKYAHGLVIALTGEELDRAKEVLTLWQEAVSFLQSQLDKDMF